MFSPLPDHLVMPHALFPSMLSLELWYPCAFIVTYWP